MYSLCLADPAANSGKHRMRNAEMQILNDLHIVRRDDYTDVAEISQLPAPETGEPHSRCAQLFGAAQPSQHVGRITTTTNGKGDVMRFREVSKLLSEDVLVVCIISPSSNHRHAIGESQYAKPLARAVYRSFSEIAGEMRGQRSTAPVAEKINRTAVDVCLDEDVGEDVNRVKR